MEEDMQRRVSKTIQGKVFQGKGFFFSCKMFCLYCDVLLLWVCCEWRDVSSWKTFIDDFFFINTGNIIQTACRKKNTEKVERKKNQTAALQSMK